MQGFKCWPFPGPKELKLYKSPEIHHKVFAWNFVEQSSSDARISIVKMWNIHQSLFHCYNVNVGECF